MMAKLRVPAGGFDLARAGERLAPMQPKPLKRYRSGMVDETFKLGLLRAKSAASALCAPNSKSVAKAAIRARLPVIISASMILISTPPPWNGSRHQMGL